MTTYVDRQRAITGLADVWSRLDDLLADVDEADWHRPTHLAGWDVQDNVAHVIGTERMLLGESPDVEIDREVARVVAQTPLGRARDRWIERATREQRALGPRRRPDAHVPDPRRLRPARERGVRGRRPQPLLRPAGVIPA